MHGITTPPLSLSRRVIQCGAQVESNFFLQSIFSKRCALACVLYAHFSKLTLCVKAFVVFVLLFLSARKSLELKAVWLHSTVVGETCGGVEIFGLLICFQSAPPSPPPPPPFFSFPPLLPSPPLSLTPLAPW